MPELFAGDLFEICGTNISLSAITDFRLRNMEYIMRPVYEQHTYKKQGILREVTCSKISFYQMEYYAAIIGEEQFINAIEDARSHNLFEAAAQKVNKGISDAVSIISKQPASKRIRYRIMNAAGSDYWPVDSGGNKLEIPDGTKVLVTGVTGLSGKYDRDETGIEAVVWKAWKKGYGGVKCHFNEADLSIVY